MILSYDELLDFVEQGGIGPVEAERINGASIDVTLGPTIYRESPNGYVVDLAKRQGPRWETVDITHQPYILRPGEFILAATRETFDLPLSTAGEFKLKSSGARAGLDNALATWADPGWHGSVLTLELRNNTQHHPLLLTYGMPIGQMVFHVCTSEVPEPASYRERGRYNGDTSVQAIKP